EPAGPRIKAEHIHSGQSTLGRGINDQGPVGNKEVVLLHDEGADVSCRHAFKRPLELGGSAYLGEMKRQSQASRGGAHLGELSLVNLVAGIGQVAYPSETGDRLR